MQYNIGERSSHERPHLKDDRSLTRIFHDIVQQHGSKIAISTGNQQISYEELNQKSNRVAHMLCDKGVKRDDIVAIFVDKSMDTIVFILGILKAGAAYMPIDIALPDSRMEYMLKNGKAKFILNAKLVRSDMEKRMKQHAIHTIADDELGQYPETDIDRRGGNNTLAYVMYTSGSEGNPKGVMIEDRGIVRLVVDEDYFPFRSDWNILQGSTLVFDASVFEVYGALLNGATLHLINNETLLNPAKLKKRIDQQPVDMMFLTTPLFHQLVTIDVGIFDHVHNLVVGGDVLFAKQARMLKQHNPRIQLFNGYGPTENTTFSTFYRVPLHVSENVPIGKPINCSTAYIFDDQKKPVRDGATGELYVGGEGVGRGYINDENLTKMKFLTHPDTGERLYRTGDLARWLEDGNIAFIGRADTQMKLRGFRIELQEVQNTINRLPEVKECAVMCETHEEEKTLVAYLVLSEGGSREAVCEQLHGTLPAYMIPNEFIILQRLPLNLNGKIDKNQLLQRRQERSAGQEPAAEDNIIITILNQQLKRRVSFKDNLYELGFNSITAVRVLSALNKQGYSVSIKAVLSVKTVREMADMVMQKERWKA